MTYKAFKRRVTKHSHHVPWESSLPFRRTDRVTAVLSKAAVGLVGVLFLLFWRRIILPGLTEKFCCRLKQIFCHPPIWKGTYSPQLMLQSLFLRLFQRFHPLWPQPLTTENNLLATLWGKNIDNVICHPLFYPNCHSITKIWFISLFTRGTFSSCYCFPKPLLKEFCTFPCRHGMKYQVFALYRKVWKRR